MFWFILKTIVAVLLLGVLSLVLLSGVGLGLACVSAGRRFGPRVLAASGVATVVTVVVGWIAFGYSIDLDIPGIVAGLTAGMCAAVVVVVGYRDLRPESEYYRLIAACVPPAALRLFDSLDADKDGLVTVPDLTRALAAGASDAGDRLILYLLREHACEIGHLPEPAVRKRLIEAEGRKWFANCDDLLSVVSRDDLASYKGKVTDRYKHWL